MKGWIFHLEPYDSYPVSSKDQKLDDQILKLFHWQWLRRSHGESRSILWPTRANILTVNKLRFVENSLWNSSSWALLFLCLVQGHSGHKIAPYSPIMAAMHIIRFTRHYFKSPIKSPTRIWLEPPTQKKKTGGSTAGLHGLWPHVAPLRATHDQWECFFFKTAGLSCSQRKKWSM